jgi:tetratricopeptide (TPR) repeat protein
MALYKDQERLCRELGNKDGLSNSLAGQALILKARGDLDGAMALHKEEERICRELGNKAGLQASLGNQAVILKARGDLDGALALYKEQERICRELDNPQGLSISLANQALLLSKAPNRRDEARRLADEAVAIANRHGFQQLVPQFQGIRDAIPAGPVQAVGGGGGADIVGASAANVNTDLAQASQTLAAPSIPDPSEDGYRAQRIDPPYEYKRMKWEALPWWERIRTPKPKPPTGI